nr:MAG TPA: hypothetical protein [Caudoviricetes sp.]
MANSLCVRWRCFLIVLNFSPLEIFLSLIILPLSIFSNIFAL